MVIITLILCFSLWNMYQSQQLADISYIQRMTSLIIYQWRMILLTRKRFSQTMKVGQMFTAILEDSEGKVLYQSIPDTGTDFANLFQKISNKHLPTESAATVRNFRR